MYNFKAAYICEMFKLSKKKKIAAAAGVTLAFTVLCAVCLYAASGLMGINMAAKSEFSLIILPVFLNVIVPLFIAFVTIDMFCGEYSSGTIKISLLSPVSRIKLYSARALAVLTFAAGMLALAMIGSFALSIVMKKTEFAVFKIFFSYLISLLPLAVIVLLAFLVANIARGSGSAFLICIIAYAGIKAAELLNPSISSFFFTGGINMYLLLSAPVLSFTKLLRLILIEIGFGTMLFAAGFMIFDNKNI